jgi:tetratricopeptide (TPR) repeat protein
LEEAESLLRAYIQQSPDDRDAQIEHLRVLLGLRRLQEATESLEKLQAAQGQPDDAAIIGIRGLWHELNGRLEEAKRDYEAALAIQPDQAFICYNLGRLLVYSIELDDEIAVEAEKHLKQAIQLNPDHFQAQFQLAALYTRLNRPVEAVEACRKTIERNPLHIPSYLFLGEIFSLLGKLNEVIELYKAGLRVNPLVHAFRDELLRLYRLQDRLDAAYNIALEQSQMRGAYEDFLELGKLALQTNQAQSAEVAFLKAESVKPQDWRAPFNLGEIYRGAKLWDKATEAYNRALAVAETAPIYTGLAIVSTQKNGLEGELQAIEYFQHAWELEPNTPEYLVNYAVALKQAGRIEDINKALERAKPLLPPDHPALQHLHTIINN